jgi:hypothetical protein
MTAPDFPGKSENYEQLCKTARFTEVYAGIRSAVGRVIVEVCRGELPEGQVRESALVIANS